MKRIASAAILMLAAVAMVASLTGADWEGNGSENLPCTGDAHWVLAPAKGITSATVHVGGQTVTLEQNGNHGSFAGDSTVPVTEETNVTYSYTGDNDKTHLQLSHCESEAEHIVPEGGVQTGNGGGMKNTGLLAFGAAMAAVALGMTVAARRRSVES